MWILYVLCIEWASVHLSLCLSVHSPFLLRSGTVHILHYNLPPALSQWWYSQHFALYYDLHFSHIPPISSQRHHWVPEHLFSPHGYTWVPTLSPGKTGFPGFINHTVHEPKTSFNPLKPYRNQTSHFLSFFVFPILAVLQWARPGGKEGSQPMSICLLPLCLWLPCSTPQTQVIYHTGLEAQTETLAATVIKSLSVSS